MSASSKSQSGPTVRHTRAIARDRSKRPNTAPLAASIQEQLTELLHPLVCGQVAVYQAMGLRQRILSLPVMVGFVLNLIWQQLGSVSEALRVLNQEGCFWVPPTPVSQQAISKRLNILPARLFQGVLEELLPHLLIRAAQRLRPLPPAVAQAQAHFAAVLCVDGSTLDALLRKVGLLRDDTLPHLGGRMAALLDVASRLPRQIWYEEDSTAHDHGFWQRILSSLEPGVLLLFDAGFLDHAIYDQLTAAEVWFVTPAKQNMAYQVVHVLSATDQERDQLIRLGSRQKRCMHMMRLLEVQVHGKWHRYLTNVLSPTRLPADQVAALYAERWRIEDAFNLVKRLLGLAYFWCGSQNGVQIQVWATWLLYAVLIDLCDAVAAKLDLALQKISIEMVFRGLYHYTQAYQQDKTLDVIDYLARKAKELGILKRQRRRSDEPPKYKQLSPLTNRAGP
jgi:hypothetical protein